MTIERIGFKRVSQHHSLADVAERLVHRMGQRVNHGGLTIAGQNEALAAMLEQVFDKGR